MTHTQPACLQRRGGLGWEGARLDRALAVDDIRLGGRAHVQTINLARHRRLLLLLRMGPSLITTIVNYDMKLINYLLLLLRMGSHRGWVRGAGRWAPNHGAPASPPIVN